VSSTVDVQIVDMPLIVGINARASVD